MADEHRSFAKAEAIKTRDIMGAFTSSEGWAMLNGILEEKEQHMLGTILDPGQELSDIALREYRMALTTIRTIREIPAAMLEDAKEVINQLAKDEAPEEEEEESFEYG